jgi:HK97 family phage major capsid protein
MTKLDAMKAKLDVLRDMAQKAVEADDMESAEKHMTEVEALEKKVEIMERLDKSEKAELLAAAEEKTEPASVEKTASFFRAVFKTIAGKTLTPAEKALLTPDPVTATGDNGEGYILPKDISTKINQLIREFRSFRGIVGKITTKALSGSMTVEDIAGITGLVNFTDGNELTESEDPQFKPVSFAMKEYGAIMYVSNVLISMSDNDLLAYVAEYFAKKAVVTENAKVIAALKYGKTAKSLATWAALSSSINTDLDPASLSRTVIVTNQNGFDYLDKQLDANNRPILQPDPTNPTVKRFKGYPVIVFSNGQLTDDETYGSPVFYGNLRDGVKFVTCGYYRFATSAEAGFTRNTTAVRLIELFDVIQWDASDECYCFGYLKEASGNPLEALTVAPETGSTKVFNVLTSSMQTGVSVSADNKITGTLKYLSGSNAITNVWGEGNFLVLKFSDVDENATSVKVGLDPSMGTGLVELLGDPDMNGIFKIENKNLQKLKVISSNGATSTTQTFDLSGLTIQGAE